MEYLLLVYEGRATATSGSNRRLEKASLENDAALRERGSLLLAAHLDVEPPGVVRLHAGTVSIVREDEALAGMYLISATDLNDAIRTAQGMPQGRHGAIEVRPVRLLRVP